MTEFPIKTEKCPICDIKLKWNEQESKGECPRCHREFHPKKIRFL